VAHSFDGFYPAATTPADIAILQTYHEHQTNVLKDVGQSNLFVRPAKLQ
jgi:hypothetical protein